MKSFAIKNDHSDKWWRFIAWLNNNTNNSLKGDASGWFYGVRYDDGDIIHSIVSSDIPISTNIITLEEWEDITNNKQIIEVW